MRGAKIIFADSRPDNPNIDETKIETLITDKTKAIVPVHYAGVACDMDTIMEIANKYNLFVIEDAAQAIDSFYNGRPLGSIGHFGTFSFHETKNIIFLSSCLTEETFTVLLHCIALSSLLTRFYSLNQWNMTVSSSLSLSFSRVTMREDFSIEHTCYRIILFFSRAVT